jgi:transcriptional regulator of acetoin/glycerol metabolism
LAPRAQGYAVGTEVDIEALPEALEGGSSLLDAYEKGALLHALRLTHGHNLAAAKLLRIGKSTFYRKLRQHGL